MSSTFIKIIACLLMLIDHIGFCFFPNLTILRSIGRLAFPLFAFQITIGYSHTRDKKKYTIRMLLFAILSQLPFLFFRTVSGYLSFKTNIGFTFFIAILCMQVIDLYREKKNITIVLLTIPLLFSAYLLKVDYSVYGVILVLLFYLFPFKDNGKTNLKNVLFFFILNSYIMSIYIVISNTLLIQYYSLLSILILLLYNEKKGPNFKYLFYIFYPLHLLILGAINYLVI